MGVAGHLIPGDRRTRYARRDRTRPVTGAQRRELELADPITQSRPHACSALGPGWWLAAPQAPARAPCGCSVSAARKWNADRATQCNRARQRRPPSGLAMKLWALARGPRTADGGHRPRRERAGGGRHPTGRTTGPRPGRGHGLRKIVEPGVCAVQLQRPAAQGPFEVELMVMGRSIMARASSYPLTC